mmetsp:Transcript_11574/g.34743  ORF Transcript_11574/g.34743 Transcript_11574/m.34743 type:complete len:116 (-) Transcript_11574:1008-1355(-)
MSQGSLLPAVKGASHLPSLWLEHDLFDESVPRYLEDVGHLVLYFQACRWGPLQALGLAFLHVPVGCSNHNPRYCRATATHLISDRTDIASAPPLSQREASASQRQLPPDQAKATA